MSYLTDEEKQQLTFDWRYRGFSTIQLLTEEECEEINTELEQLRTNRFYNKDTGNEWGEYDPFMYPHKQSEKLKELLEEAVKGIAYYGNTIGIPNVGGSLYRHEIYNKNPEGAIYYGSSSHFIDIESSVFKLNTLEIPDRNHLLNCNYSLIQQGSFYSLQMV
mgnify:CR=1 FL=1